MRGRGPAPARSSAMRRGRARQPTRHNSTAMDVWRLARQVRRAHAGFGPQALPHSRLLLRRAGSRAGSLSAVPDLVGHWQPCPGGGIDRSIGRDLQFILEDPHHLTCVLTRVPRGSLQKFVAAYVVVVDIGAAGPVSPFLCGLPPRRKTPANIATVRQNLLASRTGRRHPIIRRRLQWNALFVLKEGIDNVEKVPAELRVRTRSTRKLVVQVVLGNLGEEARRRIHDNVNAPHQLGGRQVTNNAQIDANQSRNLLERLTIHPILAAGNDRQLSGSQSQQFFQRTFIRQDVARNERYLMFAKELLSAQATGSTRLPVHLNRLPRWRSWARHDPYHRC